MHPPEFSSDRISARKATGECALELMRALDISLSNLGERFRKARRARQMNLKLDSHFTNLRLVWTPASVKRNEYFVEVDNNQATLSGSTGMPSKGPLITCLARSHQRAPKTASDIYTIFDVADIVGYREECIEAGTYDGIRGRRFERWLHGVHFTDAPPVLVHPLVVGSSIGDLGIDEVDFGDLDTYLLAKLSPLVQPQVERDYRLARDPRRVLS